RRAYRCWRDSSCCCHTGCRRDLESDRCRRVRRWVCSLCRLHPCCAWRTDRSQCFHSDTSNLAARRSCSLLAASAAERVDRSNGFVETGVISRYPASYSLLHESCLLTLNHSKTRDARPSVLDGVINAPH